MAKYSHSFNLALGALWTAGYLPTRAERSALESLIGDRYVFTPRDRIQERALEALFKLGYPLNEKPSDYDLLKKIRDVIPQDGPPTPGHSVMLATPTAAERASVISPGVVLTLEGVIGQQKRGYALARSDRGWTCSPSSWREDTNTRVISLSCGGPATVASYATDRFIKTDQTIRQLVWDFAFTPEADTAVHFQTTSPLWRWDGAESDVLRSFEKDEPSRWAPITA